VIARHEAAMAAARAKLAEAWDLAEERAARLAAADDELAGRDARIDELERVATWLSERVVARDRELRELREAHAGLRSEWDAGVRGMIALAEELEGVRRQARGQATRIRLSALREAAAVSGRLAELSKQPGEARRELIESLLTAIDRVGAEEEATEDAPAPSAEHPEGGGELFEGEVEVEIGPLRDFSQLVGFEDAAGAIVATREISVRRFAQGRATLEMRLAEPVELLRELEERSPFEFVVRDQRPDRLVLDLDSN
jgi:hypothetical protein